jgi:hypothetical protein
MDLSYEAFLKSQGSPKPAAQPAASDLSYEAFQKSQQQTPTKSKEQESLDRQRAFSRVFLSSLPGAEMAAGVVEKLGGGEYQKGRQAFAAKREEAKTQLTPLSRAIATVGGEALPYLIGGPATVMGRALMAGGIGALRGASRAGLDQEEAPSVVETAKEAAKGAALEVALEKAANLVGVAGRAVASPSRGSLLKEAAKERKAMAGPAYEQFKQLGELPMTEKLNDLMQLPIVQRAIATVQGESSKLAKLASTDAKVLDAAYKRIGNKAWASKQGFEAGTTRTDFLDAIDDAAASKVASLSKTPQEAAEAIVSQPYRTPVGRYAQGSQPIEGLTRGAKAVRVARAPFGFSERTIMEAGPEAFAEWAKSAPLAAREAAAEGIYAQLGEQPLRQIFLGQGTRQAPKLLGATGIQQNVLQRALRGAGASRSSSQ